MHLPDGLLDGRTSLLCGGLAVAGVSYAARRARAELAERTVPLTGVLGACIFAAQMVNFPVGVGVSGHLAGGTLAALVVGPWAAVLTLSVVLFVQCLLFCDGGVLALGANTLNLALIAPLGSWAVFSVLRRVLPTPRGHVVAAAVAAWAGLFGAACACAAELSLAGILAWNVSLPALSVVHSVIGLGEGLITGLTVAFLVRVQPDLLSASPAPRAERAPAWRIACAGLAVALLIGCLLAPWASAEPDGLERVLADAAAPVPEASRATPLADYSVAGVELPALATGLAAIIGVAASFALGALASRSVRERSPAA